MNQSPPVLESLLEDLSSPIHEPVRLGVLMLLHLNSVLAFSIIQKTLGVTSGNLNTHLAKLEDEGYISKQKGFVDLRPRTLVYITENGRSALVGYSGLLKKVLITINPSKIK
ncbi:MAG: transcriptional regulator [Candidatus Hodarchaeales archaeon]|jgi:DNA-binding MarR family transcriptional regulator